MREGIEDCLTPSGIRHAFDATSREEVNLAPENLAEIVFHVDEIEQAVGDLRCKGDQDVNVAVGSEVVSEHRSKQRELGDLPSLAKRYDGVARNRNAWGAHVGRLCLLWVSIVASVIVG